MPSTPRRRLTRRPPPRPTFEGAARAHNGVAAVTGRESAEARRVTQYTTRQVPYLMAELKRVAGITGVCVGILVLLTVIDRMR